MSQLDEQHPRCGYARAYRPAGVARRRRVAFVEFLAPIARTGGWLQSGRSAHHRRRRVVLLLRHQLSSWAGLGYPPAQQTEAQETQMFKRIDHVEIVTDQLDRTIEFYTDVLSFTVKSRQRIERSSMGTPMDLVYLDLGGTVVE